MPTPIPSSAALVSARNADPFAKAQDGGRRLPGPLQRANPRDLSLRPAHLLPVVQRCRSRCSGDQAGPHRAVAKRQGGARPGRIDHRSPAVDDLWVLPLRPHRRPDRLEPRAVRPSAQGPPERGPGLDRGELGTFLFTAERYDRTRPPSPRSLGSTACE